MLHLRATTFVKQQGFEFAKGDEVEVTGCKVKAVGGDALYRSRSQNKGKTG